MEEENIDTSTGEITSGDTATAEPEEAKDPIGDVAETVCRDLLEALVLEIKLLERPWDAMPQAQQDELIERLRRRLLDNMRKAIAAIVSDQRPVLPATVESVTFKDGIKATLKISKHAVGRHDLADCEGSDVIIVIVDPSQYMQGVHDVRGAPDQGEIGVEDAAAAAIEAAKKQNGNGEGGTAPTDNPRGEG
jgi:hypothetical protein